MMSRQQRKLFHVLAPILIISAICALLLGITNQFTSERIEDNRQQATLRLINDVMPLTHTNDLLNDRIDVTDASYLGTESAVSVFRARQEQNPVGLVLMPVVAKGYNGRIELAIGISYQGEITGVRVNAHRETEGLGDGIHQEKSDWILGFTDRSLANTAIDAWAVQSDGGDFDQLSGATISPRGVINAVKNALDYYEINKQSLYQ